jgi:chaperonin cofactor prefoldin
MINYSEYEQKTVESPASAKLEKSINYLQETLQAIKNAESELRELKSHKHELETKTIPTLMDSVGTAVFKSKKSGIQAELKSHYHATLPKDHEQREKAFEWLHDSGYDDLIKGTLTISFDKGDMDAAEHIYERIVQMCAEYDISPDVVLKEDVHYKTYTRVIKEEAQKGEAIPFTTLNATVMQSVKLKP